MLTENTVREHEQARRILPITVSSIPGRKRIAVLRPHGSLCAATYRDLIAEAKKLYDAGVRWFLLDLGETPYIDLSFAM
jgi:anti-anti-sigma regulatory factor